MCSPTPYQLTVDPTLLCLESLPILKRRHGAHFTWDVPLIRDGSNVAMDLESRFKDTEDWSTVQHLLSHDDCPILHDENEWGCDVRFCLHFDSQREYVNQRADWAAEFGDFDKGLMYLHNKMGLIFSTMNEVKYGKAPTLSLPINRRKHNLPRVKVEPYPRRLRADCAVA